MLSQPRSPAFPPPSPRISDLQDAFITWTVPGPVGPRSSVSGMRGRAAEVRREAELGCTARAE